MHVNFSLNSEVPKSKIGELISLEFRPQAWRICMSLWMIFLQLMFQRILAHICHMTSEKWSFNYTITEPMMRKKYKYINFMVFHDLLMLTTIFDFVL